MEKVKIIAEIGQNWMGDMKIGFKLIKLAKENGADFAKFQLYDSEILYGEYQYTEVSRIEAQQLFSYGQKIGIEVFFSVFDVERVRWCEEIGVKRYKIACRQSSNRELIEAAKRTGKPVMVSCSMPSWGQQNLFCISKYPANLEDLDFSYNKFDEDRFEGFSDHTIGLTAAKVAISRGARIIEKHFALDHKTGVDAPWSMTPDELLDLRKFADEAVRCL